MDDFIAKQNRDVFGPKGLRIENPRSQAFLQVYTYVTLSINFILKKISK